MMSCQKIDAALEKIKEKNMIFESSGKKSKETLIKTQEILECKFPMSYLYFLENLGNFSFGSFQVFGLLNDEVLKLRESGIVYGTIDDRNKFNLPYYIIILDDDLGNGDSYALDLSKMNNQKECPVIIWPSTGFQYSPHLEIVATDFGSWFFEQVERQIEWKLEESENK